MSVSYTHLDVYKRQPEHSAIMADSLVPFNIFFNIFSLLYYLILTRYSRDIRLDLLKQSMSSVASSSLFFLVVTCQHSDAYIVIGCPVALNKLLKGIILEKKLSKFILLRQ